MIGYGMNYQGFESRQAQEIYNGQTGFGAHPSLLFNGYRRLFSRGLKRLGREADHTSM
jgi:hypothetical protein